MIRKALIIGGPDSQIPGVYDDMRNYRDFFKSSSGGGWYEHEITTLENPSSFQAREALKSLQNADYSIVVFAGHGYFSGAKGCTVVELKPDVEMEEHELKVGAKKHTLIIDACRVFVPAPVQKMVFDSLTTERFRAHASVSASRRLFEDILMRCAPGIAILYSCSVHETAGDIKGEGGRYSSALLKAGVAGPASSSVDFLSISDAHERAIPYVQKQSGNRQNPKGEFPRSIPRFPFSVKA
jgi:hypothetical protein